MKHTLKLYMHDSFLDAFANLPKKIQKRTREFMKKFREAPTSSAINYEKISTFKDQSLRTVRITEKYRAIIKAPKTGNGYHLLWVDNHDEAMDWAKNKVFEWNENTQSFQMYNMPEQKIETVKTEQPTILKGIRKKDIIAIGTPEHMVEIVTKLSNLEELNSIKENLPIDTYEHLYYLIEGIPIEEILEEINAGKNESDEEQSSNAQKHVYIITEDDELEQMLSGNFNKWKIFLHPSQRNLSYRNYNGAVKVTGGAGTGKTVCAMHRVKYLIEHIDVFEKPVLFTTYTKSLTKYLTGIMKDFNLPENYLHLENFDRLVYSLSRDSAYNLIPSDSGYLNETREKEIWREVLEFNPSDKDEDFLSSEYNDVILQQQVDSLEQYLRTPRLGRSVRIGRKEKLEIWKLVEDYKERKGNNYSKYELCVLLSEYFSSQKIKPFSHLICDEVQDFSNIELTLMRNLVDEKENDLFLVGDPFQNIYSRRINFSKSGINVKGRRSRKLKVNYRTTEEIKFMAVKTIDKEKFEDFDGGVENRKGYISLLHGNEPEYKMFSTAEGEEEFIKNHLNKCLSDSNISPSDICVCARTNIGVDQVKAALKRSDFKYTDLGGNKIAFDAIRVSSFHNLKGHEFKFLVVADVSKLTVPLKHQFFSNYNAKEKKSYLKQERALYYVVFSRAIQGLLITGVGEKADWF